MNRLLSRRPLFLALAPVLLLLLGCEREGIRSYTAPRGDDPGTGPTRLLVAVVPAGDDAWFFKLVGRGDIVEAVEPAFTSVVESLRHDRDADPALSWKVPTGWKEDRDNPNRVATLRPEGVGRPDIAISKLPAAGAALKPNVDRWRRIDLGLGPISSRALDKVTRKKEVNGLNVTIVDMRGPGVEKAERPRLPAGHLPARPGRSPLNYKTPSGWKESGGGGIAAAAFTVTEGGQSARVLVTPLAGKMPGGLLANVNRWRGEVGLPDLSEAELKRADIRNVRVAGVPASYLDLPGPQQRSLVVWLEHGGRTWFFKLRGASAVVAKHKGNFEDFLQSVTFPGAADE